MNPAAKGALLGLGVTALAAGVTFIASRPWPVKAPAPPELSTVEPPPPACLQAADGACDSDSECIMASCLDGQCRCDEGGRVISRRDVVEPNCWAFDNHRGAECRPGTCKCVPLPMRHDPRCVAGHCVDLASTFPRRLDDRTIVLPARVKPGSEAGACARVGPAACDRDDDCLVTRCLDKGCVCGGGCDEVVSKRQLLPGHCFRVPGEVLGSGCGGSPCACITPNCPYQPEARCESGLCVDAAKARFEAMPVNELPRGPRRPRR